MRRCRRRRERGIRARDPMPRNGCATLYGACRDLQVRGASRAQPFAPLQNAAGFPVALSALCGEVM